MEAPVPANLRYVEIVNLVPCSVDSVAFLFSQRSFTSWFACVSLLSMLVIRSGYRPYFREDEGRGTAMAVQ